MKTEELPIPGVRDVRATLESPDEETDSVVVACPPHPQHRGHRGDERLTAVSEYLVDHGIACLRFDYGEWDEGYGEVEDARNALRWAEERYDSLGLFGFSFGGTVAALAAATTRVDLDAVALLAPASTLAADLDAPARLGEIDAPVRVVYGTRDTTADWEPLVERARELAGTVTVEEFDADHFFVGKYGTVAAVIGEFLVERLREDM